MYTPEQETAIEAVKQADAAWAAFERRAGRKLSQSDHASVKEEIVKRETPYVQAFDNAVKGAKALGLTVEDWQE